MAVTEISRGLVGGSLIALGLAVLLFVMLLSLALYIYAAIAIMTIAKKTKTKNRWLAFIPIANIYLLTQMAGKSGWLTLLVLADFMLGGLATTALVIWMFWIIAKKIKYPEWMSLLLLVPVVNLVVLGIFAWHKK